MPFPITETADLCLASTTLAKFPPILLVNICGFDPFSASLSRAIYSILCRIFLKLSIPVLLKLNVKQFINMFKGYVICSTTLRWHVLWIVDRESKYSSKA